MPAKIIVDVNKLIDQLEKINGLIWSLSVVLGIITLAPMRIKVFLGINSIPEASSMWIAIFFLFFFLVAISTTVTIVARKYKSRRQLKKLKSSFLKLDDFQKNIVLEALCSEEKTITLEYNLGVAKFLESQNFIYLPQQKASYDVYSDKFYVNYIPNPLLINLFNENPDFFLSHKKAIRKNVDKGVRYVQR